MWLGADTGSTWLGADTASTWLGAVTGSKVDERRGGRAKAQIAHATDLTREGATKLTSRNELAERAKQMTRTEPKPVHWMECRCSGSGGEARHETWEPATLQPAGHGKAGLALVWSE